MKLQSFEFHILCITFYVIQRTFVIMDNLCPNPRNYLDRSFSHIFELPSNIEPSRYTKLWYYFNCYISGVLISICGFKRINVFCIKSCLIAIEFTTSSCSYTIGLSCTTARNTAPHVYNAWGYIGINNVMVLFHISIAKSQLYKQCLAVSTRSVQKGHMLSTFPFR